MPRQFPDPTDAVSALTRPDDTTEPHSTDHGRVIGIWENAQAWGATGDGTTDDSSALQAAATASEGHVLYLPPGSYSIGTGLTLPDDIIIQGAGTGATFLVHNAGTDALLTATGSSSDLAPSGIVIRDLTLQGGTGTGNGIELNGASGAHITQTHIENVFCDGLDGPYGIKATWALETMITRCAFRNQAEIGIGLIDSCNASVIRDCTLSNSGTGTTAIDLVSDNDNLTGVLIDGCVIEAWRGSYGIRASAVGGVHIRNSHFEDNRGVDIGVESSSPAFSHSVVIEGNHFSPDSSQTNLISLEALNGTLIGNNISTKAVALETAGGGNVTYYTLLGNRFVSSASIDDNTTGEDQVVYFGNKGITNVHGIVGGHIEINGDLNHDGSKVGFYGVTPASRPGAYTQTYSTANKTHAAPTAATLTVADGAGTNDNTIGEITADASVIAAVQEIADEINKLVADVADVKQLANSIIDDLQTLGLLQ